MATVNSRDIVDAIIAGDGWYPGDKEDGNPRCVRIVKYNNQFNGAVAYGLIYVGDPLDRYHTAEACHNVETIWDAS